MIRKFSNGYFDIVEMVLKACHAVIFSASLKEDINPHLRARVILEILKYYESEGVLYDVVVHSIQANHSDSTVNMKYARSARITPIH